MCHKSLALEEDESHNIYTKKIYFITEFFVCFVINFLTKKEVFKSKFQMFVCSSSTGLKGALAFCFCIKYLYFNKMLKGLNKITKIYNNNCFD